MQKEGVTKGFLINKSGFKFLFQALFGKIVAVPPVRKALNCKILVWDESVYVPSIKNMFGVPGGIR